MKFMQKTLSNGLTIIGEQNQEALSAAMGFFVKTGSRDENSGISGVSHFLEHMLFKGTDSLGPLEVNALFDKSGAQFNAFTSEENTVYYAGVLPEYMSDVTELWCKLMRPSLRNEDFDMEKNVIKEEIAMYQDSPAFDVSDKCRELYFGEHPCGNSVLGTNKTIDDLTADQMRQYFNKRYAPNNVTLCVVGNYDWAVVCQIAEKFCGSWTKKSVDRTISDYTGIKQSARQAKANLSREHICLISSGVSAQDPRRFANSLLGTIVGDDTGSRYFWELTDKALAETASMQYMSMDGVGLVYSYFRCDKDKSEQVIEIVGDIHSDLQKNGVTEAELTKAKNKILSALVIKNEVSMGRLLDVGFNWTYLNQYRPMADDITAIKSVTVSDINGIISQFDFSAFAQYSLGPA